MSRNSTRAPAWNEDGVRSMFAPLRAREAAPPPDLRERTLDHLEIAITARDLVELGTIVMVVEFLGPVLDLLAFTLGLDGQGGSVE